MNNASQDQAKQIDRWAKRPQRALLFVREKGVGGIVSAVRRLGVRGSVGFFYRQVRYSICYSLGKRWDRNLGVDTSGQLDLDQLEIVGGNREHGRPVVSTSPKMFKYLRRFHPAETIEYTFIDVGCGKGRVVLMACLEDFKRVVGVEFAPLPSSIATANLQKLYDRSLVDLPKCDLCNEDILDFDLPDGPLVVNCFNPFGVDVWLRFLPRIIEKSELGKRIRLVIYGTVEEDVSSVTEEIESSGHFIKRFEGSAPRFLDSYLTTYYVVFDLDNMVKTSALQLQSSTALD